MATTAKQDSAGADAEATMLALVRAGDRRAFEALYHAYHARLSRFLHKLLRRPHVVEEVLNDAMLVVWNRLDTFDGRSRFSTWLFGIAYRQALAALRRLDEPVDDERDEAIDHAASPGAGAEAARVRRGLDAALATLSPTHRAVVELTYFHEFGYREIAAIMDCPPDTVKTRMFHARRHLRAVLPGEPGDWY
ncbi:sigma-70 family RNA polymerase sigma factor [Sphingomonas sp. BK580]|uniref:sigma-70 family RNA polymerase sigma factor n=1 Tax=Sphingomonas sp. BK580 TaxID=2586972 RepID=UPI0017F766B1|nr:sigma-70 family RNA polymerase sigma factor [Sphingomonas sp. BK580]MBB3693450.1 RNA polymerase sigma-70 factor (ECF subfamily) [Sphingomonas sp. BK580]